ncbi:MAG: hypothetical protein NXI24_11080 [bacterium]|nr:hypothetical protein [bacterium]
MQTGIQRGAIAAAITVAFLAGGASLSAGPKEKVIGGSKFAARILYELDTKDSFSTSTQKSNIGAKAAFAGRLFGKNTPYLAEGQIELGNYGSYKKKKMKVAGREYNIPAGVDVNKMKKWELRSKFRLFNITLTDQIKAAPQDVTSSTVKKEWKPFKSYKYSRRDLASVRFMVGPVPFSIRFGASGGFGVEPKFGFDVKKLGVSAELKPSASASAFAEGGPSIYVLRGGVGVSLMLINGSAGVKAALEVLGAKAFTFKFVSGVKAMQGRVYAFVDRRKRYLWGKWKRWINKTLYQTGALTWNRDQTICKVPLSRIFNGSFKCQ